MLSFASEGAGWRTLCKVLLVMLLVLQTGCDNEQKNKEELHKATTALFSNRGPYNVEEAVNTLQKLVSKGDSEAERALAACYIRGLGVSKDNSEAVRLLESAVKKNNIHSMADLGPMYISGDGTTKNVSKGVELIIKSAESGSELGKYEAVECMESGAVPMDINKAYQYCSSALASLPKRFDDSCGRVVIDHFTKSSTPIKSLTDQELYEIGLSFHSLNQIGNAKKFLRLACYGKDESDNRNPQSPACMAYYQLEMGQQ